MSTFLNTEGANIVLNGRPVYLRGVNVGGWLMMEGYIMHAPNRPVKLFKKQFKKALGAKALQHFENSFYNNFIKPKDFNNIARLGFNCIRVPFHHGLIERAPYRYHKDGLRYLDQAVRWAKKNKIWIILDLHGAAGSQNHDWHSDSDGEAQLWKRKGFQRRTLALWKFLADRYKDEPSIAGYDILNEAVLTNTKILNAFYKRVIRTIRQVDRNHILFVEGNNWAMDLDCLDDFDDDNLALSVHAYRPLDFTFNFVPHLQYPWNRRMLHKLLSQYKRISRRRKVPIFVGEFGVNYRQGLYGEDKWLKDTLRCFNDFGFHWTYWTYKAIKNSAFPDGIYSFYDNPPWVHREGPLKGWENYAAQWPKRKKDMIKSWDTNRFRANTHVLRALKNAAKENH